MTEAAEAPTPARQPLLEPTATAYFRLLGKALLTALVLRLVISIVTFSIGGHWSASALLSDGYLDAPFFTITDVFADSLKSGMAQTTITAPLVHDPAVQSWHPFFRAFLFHNEYLQNGLTIHQTPPLANLQLMAVAWGIAHGSPELVAITEILLFALFGWALSGHPAFATHAGSSPWVWAILCLSYPALFMIDRGNFHSGFASLAVCTYLVSLFSARVRVLGVLVMAVAINYRPNLALLTLVEFTATPFIVAAALRIIMIGAVTAMLVLFGYVACHIVDPAYTMAAIVDGLSRYETVMVTKGGGLDWNSSLFGVFERAIALLPHSVRPANAEALLRVNDHFFVVTMAVCAAIGLTGVWAFATGRIRPLEATFLLLALNMLGTPVYAEYHMLIYAAALLLLPMEWKEERLPIERYSLVVTCALFALLSLLRSALPLSLATFLMLLIVPCALWHVVLRRIPPHDSEAGIIFVAAFWGMCSLGGRYSQGPMEAASILIASSLILHRVMRRPIGTVRPPLLPRAEASFA